MAIKLANNFKPNQNIKTKTDPKNIIRVIIPLTSLSKPTTSQFVNINLTDNLFISTFVWQLTFKNSQIAIDINLTSTYNIWTIGIDGKRQLYGTGDGATVVDELKKTFEQQNQTSFNFGGDQNVQK